MFGLLVNLVTEKAAERRALQSAEKGFDLSRDLSRLQMYVRMLSPVLGHHIIGQSPQVPVKRSPGQSIIDFSKEVIGIVSKRYGVSAPTAVRFSSLHGPAGLVTNRGGMYYIDIESRYKEDDRAVLAILAHEFGHIFLAERRTRLESIWDNEELTDTAAVLAGFGLILLRASYRPAGGTGTFDNFTGYEQIGYLAPTAVAYLTILQSFGANSCKRDLRRLLGDLGYWKDKPINFIRSTRCTDGHSIGCLLCGTPLRTSALSRSQPGCACCGLNMPPDAFLTLRVRLARGITKQRFLPRGAAAKSTVELNPGG